jgi:hypothetical protein
MRFCLMTSSSMEFRPCLVMSILPPPEATGFTVLRDDTRALQGGGERGVRASQALGRLLGASRRAICPPGPPRGRNKYRGCSAGAGSASRAAGESLPGRHRARAHRRGATPRTGARAAISTGWWAGGGWRCLGEVGSEASGHSRRAGPARPDHTVACQLPMTHHTTKPPQHTPPQPPQPQPAYIPQRCSG